PVVLAEGSFGSVPPTSLYEMSPVGSRLDYGSILPVGFQKAGDILLQFNYVVDADGHIQNASGKVMFFDGTNGGSAGISTLLNWDPKRTGSSTGASGGAGTWDTDTALWFNSGSGSNAIWDSVSLANFGGSAGGAVTVSDHSTPMPTCGMTFNTAGYTIGGVDGIKLIGPATVTMNQNATITTKVMG